MTDEYPYDLVARHSAQEFRGLACRHVCVLDHDLKLPAMVWVVESETKRVEGEEFTFKNFCGPQNEIQFSLITKN